MYFLQLCLFFHCRFSRFCSIVDDVLSELQTAHVTSLVLYSEIHNNSRLSHKRNTIHNHQIKKSKIKTNRHTGGFDSRRACDLVSVSTGRSVGRSVVSFRVESVDDAARRSRALADATRRRRRRIRSLRFCFRFVSFVLFCRLGYLLFCVSNSNYVTYPIYVISIRRRASASTSTSIGGSSC